jgi:hypothetical protein
LTAVAVSPLQRPKVSGKNAMRRTDTTLLHHDGEGHFELHAALMRRLHLEILNEERRAMIDLRDREVINDDVLRGTVYTPLHRNTPKEVMEGRSPMGQPSTVKDITDAVMYLTGAATVTGHILHVDDGANFGRS